MGKHEESCLPKALNREKITQVENPSIDFDGPEAGVSIRQLHVSSDLQICCTQVFMWTYHLSLKKLTFQVETDQRPASRIVK